jgi:hypothetical protein
VSEIPYIFETPVPADFRKNGWFKCDNTLKFVTWAFSRCSTREREIIFNHKKIHLKPFQFLYGREICSLETNMSTDEARYQANFLVAHGFLRKVPNKTPNRFTVYEWVTEAFSQINPQQNPQQNPNKTPTKPHNLEDKINTDTRSDDLIDLEIPEGIDLIKFRHKKTKVIFIEKSELFEEFESLGYSSSIISHAIDKMKKFDPELNGTIQSYLKTTIENTKQQGKSCKTKTPTQQKPKSMKNNNFYSGEDLSQSPLASFARQNGLK